MPNWFRRASARLPAPRLGSRAEGKVLPRVELAELTPTIEQFLGLSAYLQLTFFESLARATAAAPTTAAKEQLAGVAALALEKHRGLASLIDDLGSSPAVLMEPHVLDVDRFERLTRGSDWYEQLVSNVVTAGFLDEFFVQLGRGLPADTAGRVARILATPTGEQHLLALISAGIDDNPTLASRLAMWGRRLVGDTMLLARGALVMHTHDASDEARIEPVFTELIAAHTRRMDALGLTA